MSKTLVVTYLPKGDSSNTKKLLDGFLAAAEGKTEIDHLDLTKEQPQMVVTDNLFAYMKRAFQGQELNSEEQNLMSVADKLTDRLIQADYLVVAAPVHNFSVPGIIKVWLDNVVQKGKTFDFGAEGAVGLMKDKPAMALYTAGFWYSAEHYKLDWNTFPEVMEANLAYMGYDPIKLVGVDGINMKSADEIEKAYATALAEIQAEASRWYLA